jgi:hypothetical protein
MNEQELNKKLADPTLTPQEKKKLQDQYNKEHKDAPDVQDPR